MAFVAPDSALPRIVHRLSEDLQPRLLESIGPTEAAIFRTPEGTNYVDVLSPKGQPQISKNTKDYDTLKWEQELRMQLAQKKGEPRKLTAEDQAKIKAQLAKEAGIRAEVAAVEAKMRRGIGIIQSLATGPPTDAEQWIGTAVDSLIEVIRSGAGLILGNLPALAFVACAQRTSTRLGTVRSSVGVATLRMTGSIQLPQEMTEESLDGMFKENAPACAD